MPQTIPHWSLTPRAPSTHGVFQKKRETSSTNLLNCSSWNLHIKCQLKLGLTDENNWKTVKHTKLFYVSQRGSVVFHLQFYLYFADMMRWVGGKMVPVGDIYLIYFTYPTLHGIFFMEVVLMDEATKNTPMLFAYSMGDNFFRKSLLFQ